VLRHVQVMGNELYSIGKMEFELLGKVDFELGRMESVTAGPLYIHLVMPYAPYAVVLLTSPYCAA
jgi:hypothetical protein